ncbi:nitrite reductase (NADH) small subunit [bacterium A37T11]|nr:nitrite reductase (NADH) small subunit [bacterium A37T11]
MCDAENVSLPAVDIDKRMKWIKLFDTDVPQQEGVWKTKAGGKKLCVVRHVGKLYATSAECPHAGADLSAGWCESGRLICPYHRQAFNLENGRGDPGQGNYIHIYPLEQRGDAWYVGMKESLLSRLFKK